MMYCCDNILIVGYESPSGIAEKQFGPYGERWEFAMVHERPDGIAVFCGSGSLSPIAVLPNSGLKYWYWKQPEAQS